MIESSLRRMISQNDNPIINKVLGLLNTNAIQDHFVKSCENLGRIVVRSSSLLLSLDQRTHLIPTLI